MKKDEAWLQIQEHVSNFYQDENFVDLLGLPKFFVFDDVRTHNLRIIFTEEEHQKFTIAIEYEPPKEIQWEILGK